METDVDTSLSLNRIRNSERLTDFSAVIRFCIVLMI